MGNGPVLPEFSLKDFVGVERKFPSGRNALLCFVKEDCATCDMTMPIIEAAARRFRVEVDVVAIGQDAEGNARLVERHQIKTPMLDDSALKVSFAYNLETVPTIILAAPDGSEMRRFVGFDKTDWQELLAEMAQSGRHPRAPAIDWSELSRNRVPDAARNRSSRGWPSGWRPRRAARSCARVKSRLAQTKTRSNSCSSADSPMACRWFLPRPSACMRMLTGTRRDPQRSDRDRAAESGAAHDREDCRQRRDGRMQARIFAGGDRGARSGLRPTSSIFTA